MGGENTQLFVLVLGHAFSAVILFLLASLVFTQNARRFQNVLFASVAFVSALVSIHTAFGVELPPSASATIWWRLGIILYITLAALMAHFALTIVKREVSWRWYLALVYVAAVLLLGVVITYPNQIIPLAHSIAYLNTYFVAGPLFYLVVAYFVIAPLVPFIELLRQYAYNIMDRKRAVYFIFAFLITLTFSQTLFLLAYGVPVDPFWTIFFGWYTIPIAYGIVSENLLDVNSVIRKAFLYAAGVALATGGIMLIGLLNDYIRQVIPGAQLWFVPLVAGTMAVFVGRAFLVQSVESERLKYEFITIATHKLRTPLTRIKWEIASLLTLAKDNPKMFSGLQNIDNSNNRLIELTSVLLESARSQDNAYAYSHNEVDFRGLVESTMQRFDAMLKQKNLNTLVDLPSDVPRVFGDVDRLISVVDVMLENAITYTPANGLLHVRLESGAGNIRFSVTDSGMGISKKDAAQIFNNFFRSAKAKTADTEGVGIGLSVSKNIIEKHGGTMGFESEGEGKGATFWFTLPVE